MKLIDFLNSCKKLIEENPDALQMEMFGIVGSSGTGSEMGNPYISTIEKRSSGEFPVEDMLPNDYEYDKIIWVYMGN
jgi:hypothetical protein